MLKYHVAVCDDEKSDLDGIVQSVQQYDVQGCFDIETYMDGNELLSELQMQKKSFDLLLLDIEMPSNGFQLAQSLIQMEKHPLGKVTKNNGNRCSAYVPEHHEAIVSPEIARAAHLVASSKKKCGVQDIVVIQQGALKGFVGIHPNWSGINAESIRSLCLNAYLPEEVVELNDMTEMRSGKKLDMALLSDYLTVSGTCFINQSSPVITISKNGIRFSKACHTRLDDCEHVELLYHPILQVVILRKSNRDASTAIHWENKDKICSSFSSRAFSGVIFEAMNWKWSCRYQCRGICRGKENAKFLIFELDESRILIGKNQYEQIEGRSIDLKCRLYRSKWIQSIAASDVMKFGQVVENPMIGAIPSRNEVQRELDDLLMSM